MQDTEIYESLRYFGVKAFNLIVIIVAFVMFNSWAAKANAHDEMVEEQIAAAERAANRGPYTNDGTFEGSAQGYGGPVKMQAVIKDGYIDSVTILDAGKEDEAWLDMCVDLPKAIVKAQSTDIDVVSGATYTSSGILNGTTEALKKSLGGDAA